MLPTINKITPGEGWGPAPGPQEEALCRSEKYLLLGGARMGGKTDLGLAWNADPDYIQHPEYRSLVIRKDYDDLTDWIFRAKIFYSGLGEVIGNPAYIRWEAGGITRLGHWKDKKTISKYIGHEYWKILIEELTQSISTFKEFESLMGSLRMPVHILQKYPNIFPQFMANTNPGGPGHDWVYKYWVLPATNKCYTDPETGDTRIFIPFKATDNPYCPDSYLKYLDGLSEPLRSAWRDGSWTNFEGQFFTEFDTHLAEEPFTIPRELCKRNLYGGLDIGIGHPTSFGLNLVDHSGIVHRLFTYKNRGMTHREHAQAIYDRIAHFDESHRCFPQIIWIGHDAFAKNKNNPYSVTSPVEEYRSVFKGTCTRFVCANTDRSHGCGTMRKYFKVENEMARFRYWKRYNESFYEAMIAVLIDPDKPEEYMKQSGDDPVDECRYGLNGIDSQMSLDYQAEDEKADEIISEDCTEEIYDSFFNDPGLA